MDLTESKARVQALQTRAAAANARREGIEEQRAKGLADLKTLGYDSVEAARAAATTLKEQAADLKEQGEGKLAEGERAVAFVEGVLTGGLA